ncbi:type II toxin-antitoxin system RelE/ParE family toxin [Neorhizobium tomejilense]|uniref:type II toxin-antitoxin system RelE/ParE family toxin n=1 Tax=Neorhizobium tomejilense TaxID=2093828 RepID=UPI000CF9D13F|nr:type II toxin-antitoxin system RelE/ParE family toxin [Neorhizobium tomejilense]
MKRYRVRLTEEAEADVAWIYRSVRRMSSSALVARNYIARVRAFLTEFETFPERGTIRDARNGMRLIGFERRVSVAFVVEDNEVVILRLLYAGQHFQRGEDPLHDRK